MTVTDNKTLRRLSRFKYTERSAQDVEQHIQRGSFPEALRQASGGNLEPLHKYLRAFLPEDHADVIIEWARRRLRPDLIKKAASPERQAENLIAATARWGLRNRRKYFGKLPRGAIQQEIRAAADLLGEDGDLSPADPDRIDFKRIRDIVKRGTKRRS
jgi:hypothetical protein